MRPDDPSHQAARDAVRALLKQNEVLYLTPQVIREFWSVSTRPREQNGLGMTTEEASSAVKSFEGFSTIRPDTAAVHEHWREIVVAHRVAGKETHDAGLVAAMKAHAIASILTFDAADFARYKDIVAVRTPAMILNLARAPKGEHAFPAD